MLESHLDMIIAALFVIASAIYNDKFPYSLMWMIVAICWMMLSVFIQIKG